MRTFITLLMLIIAFTSCSTNTSSTFEPNRTKPMRTVQVHKLTSGGYVCLDSAILVRRVDTLLRVGDVVKYAKRAYMQPDGYMIVE